MMENNRQSNDELLRNLDYVRLVNEMKKRGLLLTQEDVEENQLETLKKAYPVGQLFINATDGTNPSTLLGFGTWVKFGEGRVLVGLDSGDSDFNSAEETGGAKSFNNRHRHGDGSLRAAIGAINNNVGALGYDATGPISGVSYNISVQGMSNTSLTNINHSTRVHGVTDYAQSSSQSLLQPYITVYMWKRTA